MTPAIQKLHDELVSKSRSGWAKNGFEDALNGKLRLPTGSTFYVIDQYKEGYNEGEQVLAMRNSISDQLTESADD